MSNSTSYVSTITGRLIANPEKSVKEGKKTLWKFKMAKDAKDGGKEGNNGEATYWINFTYRGDHEILEKAKQGDVLTITADKPYILNEYTYTPYRYNPEKGTASAGEQLDAFGIKYGSFVVKKEGENKTPKQTEETVEHIIDSPESFFPPDELIQTDAVKQEALEELLLGS